MSKAYTDKEQFSEDTNKNISKIEQILNSQYEKLLNEGYTIIEIHDIINYANNLQRGKHIWNRL